MLALGERRMLITSCACDIMSVSEKNELARSWRTANVDHEPQVHDIIKVVKKRKETAVYGKH